MRRLAVMTLTLPEADTGLSILEDVDLTLEPACEHPSHPTEPDWHGGPAELIVERLKPCGCPAKGQRRLLLCKTAWEYAFRTGLVCGICRQPNPRDEVWGFVSWL